MWPVTQDFIDAATASVRRWFGKVVIDYTDTEIDQSITIDANEEINIQKAQVANALSTPTYKYASLDGSWLLDGTFHLAPDEDEAEMGWWGSSLAGTGGVFSIPYPRLTAEFFSRPIRSLMVVGDDKRGEYPVDFTIKLYGSGDALLHTETVSGNSQISWSTDITQISQVVKMTLEISKWSHEGRQVKILEFFTSIQETYEGDDILLIDLLEERDVSQGSLPIGNISANELMVQLNNIDNKFDAGNTSSSLYELLKANRRIRAWLGMEVSGSIEWVPLGVFYSGDWDVPENEVYAQTVGLDMMERLRNSNYSTSAVQQNKTLYELAGIVLQDAGLTPDEYWIDIELQNYTVPYAWFEPMSHRAALRKIVEACAGQAYCSREGIIRLEGPSFLTGQTTSVLTVSRNDIWGKDNPVKWSEIANYIEVDTAPLQPSSAAEEVYRSNDPLIIGASSTKTLTLYYNKTPCIDAVASLEGATNTSITSVTYYAWGASIELTNSGGSSENVTVVAYAKPLEVQNKQRAIAQDTNSIVDNGKIKYTFPENNLIQNLGVAQIIANNILAAFRQPRRDIDLDWRGNPALLLADRITAPDYKDISTQDYHITSQQLVFDGGLKSKIKGRRS